MDLNSDLYTSLLGLDLAFRMILAIPAFGKLFWPTSAV